MDSDSRTSGKHTKSVSKKVSFSIFEVDTFDQIVKNRKEREAILNKFIQNKKQTNLYISLMKKRNKSNEKIEISRNNDDNDNDNQRDEDDSKDIKNVKKYINKKYENNKERFPLKSFLTDEDNESMQKMTSVKRLKDKEKAKMKKKQEENIKKFTKILEKIIFSHKIRQKKIIFDTFLKYNEYLINKYLDSENDSGKEDQNYLKAKINFYSKKKMFESFINNVKQRKYNKMIYKKNLEEAEKFAAYSIYKKKVLVFEALKNYGIKQRIWLNSIQSGLKKDLIWSCIDSWKLYVNYKKIKRFLILRKKKIIFDALKNNKQLSINLLKQGKKISLILEYRHFFNNVRKNILSEKAKDINKKLYTEFRKQYLMKNLFNLLKVNHRIKKEKENKYKKIFLSKYEDKDFINIKISSKETYRMNERISVTNFQNKINI